MNVAEYRKMTQPKIKETDITRAILQFLKARGIFAWKVFQSLGSTKGVPDILGVLPGGRSLMIEVKTPKGKLSEHQEAFLTRAKAEGACAFVARSVEDLMGGLKEDEDGL